MTNDASVTIIEPTALNRLVICLIGAWFATIPFVCLWIIWEKIPIQGISSMLSSILVMPFILFFGAILGWPAVIAGCLLGLITTKPSWLLTIIVPLVCGMVAFFSADALLPTGDTPSFSAVCGASAGLVGTILWAYFEYQALSLKRIAMIWAFIMLALFVSAFLFSSLGPYVTARGKNYRKLNDWKLANSELIQNAINIYCPGASIYLSTDGQGMLGVFASRSDATRAKVLQAELNKLNPPSTFGIHLYRSLSDPP